MFITYLILTYVAPSNPKILVSYIVIGNLSEDITAHQMPASAVGQMAYEGTNLASRNMS